MISAARKTHKHKVLQETALGDSLKPLKLSQRALQNHMFMWLSGSMGYPPGAQSVPLKVIGNLGFGDFRESLIRPLGAF